jgi:hypothetical protein
MKPFPIVFLAGSSLALAVAAWGADERPAPADAEGERLLKKYEIAGDAKGLLLFLRQF